MDPSVRRTGSAFDPTLLLVGCLAAALAADALGVGVRNALAAGVIRGPWMLVRILPFLYLYRIRDRGVVAPALACGLMVGQLLASATFDPIVRTALASVSRFTRWEQAVAAIAVVAVALDRIRSSGREAPLRIDTPFLVRAASGVMVVVVLAAAPLMPIVTLGAAGRLLLSSARGG